MTGWCRKCGAAVRVRHTRGTRLADCRCSCGGDLAATITVARALGVGRYESYRVYDVAPAERVEALARAEGRASAPEDVSPDKERESFGA